MIPKAILDGPVFWDVNKEKCMYNIDSERAGTCKIMRSAPSK
jgi:hypothetical protein